MTPAVEDAWTRVWTRFADRWAPRIAAAGVAGTRLLDRLALPLLEPVGEVRQPGGDLFNQPTRTGRIQAVTDYLDQLEDTLDLRKTP